MKGIWIVIVCLLFTACANKPPVQEDKEMGEAVRGVAGNEEELDAFMKELAFQIRKTEVGKGG